MGAATNNYNGANAALYGDPDLDDPARGPLLFAYRAWGEDEAYLDLSTGCWDADDGLALLARVAVGGELRRIRGSLGAVGPLPDALASGGRTLTWQEGDLLVGVHADGVDEATIEEFVTGEQLALSGRADGRHTRGRLLSEEGEVDRFASRPGTPGREQFVADDLEDFGVGRVVIVQVRADVAKVLLTTRPDGERIELSPGPSVLPDGSRFFGTWLDESHRIGRVTSYDADGGQIAYQTSLAPYATPHVN